MEEFRRKRTDVNQKDLHAKWSGVYELYYLDLANGLRRGELLSLEGTDIDFRRRTLRIQRSISRQSGKVVKMLLKMKDAYRTMLVQNEAISVLKEQRRKAGNGPYVFSSPNRRFHVARQVLHRLQRFLKRTGLPRLCLRHTFAVLAHQNGADMKTVSGILERGTSGGVRFL